MKRATLVLAALVLSVGGAPRVAHGGPILSVFVGYADTLRPNPFFPSPWQGSPSTSFVGYEGGLYDTGAIRIDNLSGAAITVDVKVTLLGGLLVYDIWG